MIKTELQTFTDQTERLARPFYAPAATNPTFTLERTATRRTTPSQATNLVSTAATRIKPDTKLRSVIDKPHRVIINYMRCSRGLVTISDR